MSRMHLRAQLRFRAVQTSLRIKVALGVALPVLLVLTGLALTHYWRERQLLQDQIVLTVSGLGEVMIGSLRYTMLSNNGEALAQTLSDISAMDTVQQVQIVGLDGQVKAASTAGQVGRSWRLDERGCIECHQLPAESRPRTTRSSTVTGLIRVAVPIKNDADCSGCHALEGSHLGVLLADLSVEDIEDRLRHNLQVELALSIGITLLVTIAVYLLIHRLVVRRVEALHEPLAQLASGDFTSRLPESRATMDELSVLADTVNRMAGELERRALEREERERLRQQAIAEERGRIARELHDGLAQLLGYANAKAAAVRLMLQNRELEAADQTLQQLEDAARGLFVDVRKAIVDLKAPGQESVGLTAALRDYTARFSRLSDLPVELTAEPAAENLSLAAEPETALLRIVQEALANVDRHASADSAYVSLQIRGAFLELTVGDDGVGFDPEQVQADGKSHFGLNTMRERAEEIDAALTLKSKPGAGTCITVRLPLQGIT